MDIRFSKGADRFSFPVAAASILAKYTRELFMKNLNDYWCGRIDGLKPTAGYPEDAKRFMYVVMPELLASGYSENWSDSCTGTTGPPAGTLRELAV